MANLNIKDIAGTDLDFFNSLKTENRTSKEVIALLIKAYKEGVTQQPKQSNPDLEDKFKEVTQNLQEVTQSLLAAENQIDSLNTQVFELQAKEVIEPNFVVTPTPAIAKAIELIQPGFYKKELTKNTDQTQYRNELAKYALRYLAQNEFKKYLNE